MVERPRGAAVWIATCGGTGYFPIAPGTAGSLVGVALVAALGHLPLRQPWLWGLLSLALLSIFLVGAWSATEAEKLFGHTDPGQVVIDEVAGQMLTLFVWPGASWKRLLAGFVLFRFFDILKPFPVRRAEHLRGGWGIMTDDLLAGAYGMLTLEALDYFLR